MKLELTRTRIVGALFALIGAAAAILASASLSLGSLARMGPGMFPMLVGIVLATLGLVLAFQPASTEEERVDSSVGKASLVPFLANTAAILVFAVCLDHFGLVPAVIGLSFVAGFSVKRPTVAQLVIVPIVLAVIAAAIFKFGLGLPVELFEWPL